LDRLVVDIFRALKIAGYIIDLFNEHICNFLDELVSDPIESWDVDAWRSTECGMYSSSPDSLKMHQPQVTIGSCLTIWWFYWRLVFVLFFATKLRTTIAAWIHWGNYYDNVSHRLLEMCKSCIKFYRNLKTLLIAVNFN
jgi:hypothetical protein